MDDLIFALFVYQHCINTKKSIIRMQKIKQFTCRVLFITENSDLLAKILNRYIQNEKKKKKKFKSYGALWVHQSSSCELNVCEIHQIQLVLLFSDCIKHPVREEKGQKSGNQIQININIKGFYSQSQRCLVLSAAFLAIHIFHNAIYNTCLLYALVSYYEQLEVLLIAKLSPRSS